MKKLFLASSAGTSLNKIDELLEDKPANLKVAFIPTASEPYGVNPEWLVADRNQLIAKGFSVTDIDIKNKTKEELKNTLKSFDIIFVAGGNTFYLLEKVKENGFDEVIKDFVLNGKLYIGSSAGALLAGSKLLDDEKAATSLASYEALGLVHFVVLPHYGKPKYAHLYKQIIEDPNNRKYELIPLTDEQAVIVKGDTYKVV